MKDEFLDDFKAAMDTDDKTVRDARLLPIRDKISEKYAEQWGEGTIEELMYKMQKFVVRRWLLDEGKRVDGRGINEIRPLAAEVGLLPRATPARPAAPAAAKLGTAPWPSAPCCLCCPLWKSFRMPCALCLRFCPPTALPARHPSAVPRWH